MTPIKEEQITSEIVGRVFKLGNGWTVVVQASAAMYPLYMEAHQSEGAAIDDLQKMIIRWREPHQEIKNEI